MIDKPDTVDVEFSMMCASTHGGTAEYDPFGDDESVYIEDGSVVNEAEWPERGSWTPR